MEFKKLNQKLLKIFVISILLIGGILISIDIKGFINTANTFSFRYMPIVLLLIFLNYIFRFIKWRYYLRQLSIDISIIDSIKIFLCAMPMTITPGKVGELLKSYLLKIKHNYPISQTSPLVVVERLTDAVGMIVLAGVGALTFNYGVGVLGVLAIVVAVGIYILQNNSICNKLINLLNRVPLLSKYGQTINNFYTNFNYLLKLKVLIIGVIIGTIAWILEGATVYFLIISMGVDVSFLYSIFIMAFSSIVGVLSMIPGGIVASEGSIFALLLTLGIERGSAGFLVLLIRFATLWLGVIVGTIVLLKVERELFMQGYKDFDVDKEIINPRETKDLAD